MREEDARATTLKTREHFGIPRRQLHALLLPLIVAETATIKQLQVRDQTSLDFTCAEQDDAVGSVPHAFPGSVYAVGEFHGLASFLYDRSAHLLLVRLFTVRADRCALPVCGTDAD